MSTRRSFPLLPPNSALGWTPYAWLVYLPSFLISPVVMTSEGAAAWWMWPATIVALAIFLYTYFRGHWLRGVKLIPIAATHVALAVLFSPINYGACVFYVYATSFIAQLDRPRDALRGIVLVVAIAIATGLLVQPPAFYWITAVPIALMIGGINLHFYQAAHAQRKLRLAHAEIEQLAAIAERERIARDLHDVLGHTLSLIVLKAELAVKLSARDPERAAREMRDVEEVARRTLQDVRHAIRGYRATLVEEIERSRTMLKASRIADELDVAHFEMPPVVEETLALALREAVTNVVRHSGASSCTVRLTRDVAHVTLEVRDDGRGSTAPPGLGLRGMHERVESIGGTMTIEGGRGMRLLISVPVGVAEPGVTGLAQGLAQGRGAAHSSIGVP